MKLNGKQLEVVIDDLSGKYYGTEISILNPDGESEWSFTLWNTSGYNPSERELEGYPFTYQEYIENKPFEVKEDGGIYCDWHKGDMVKPQDYYEICDSHWEGGIMPNTKHLIEFYAWEDLRYWLLEQKLLEMADKVWEYEQIRFNADNNKEL